MRALILLCGVSALVVVAIAVPVGAQAEQASQPSSPAAGQLDAGGQHTCALVAADVRCWGLGSAGQLGYGNTNSIGDNETPGSTGPVDLGPGRPARALSAGDSHTCALLDTGGVRCWGFGADGRLGYGNEQNVGDNETPASVGPVDLGGRRATAISAGGAHTCALIDDGSVLCWGFAGDGRLGYGVLNPDGLPEDIGDNETPGSRAPVNLGRAATAISAGGSHTCALLDDDSVRCWGFGGEGRLGYNDPTAASVGDDEAPGSVGPVSLGAGATALSSGGEHTCAVLDGGDVRCWGVGLDGRLGYGNEFRVGDNETPGSVNPVALGTGTAVAISAGGWHTCARFEDGTARCWGLGTFGRLGYGNPNSVGDNEHPGSVDPVGLGQTTAAISAGRLHVCARLDDATLRCWGFGLDGRLGYGNVDHIGDNEPPSAAGPVPVKTRASINDITVSEGDSGERTLSFTVRLASASGEAASVAYATANGSATAPADYAAGGGTLTFAPGETSKSVAVRVKGDTLDEPDERFFVDLSSPTNLTIGDGRGTGTITDDDAAVARPVPFGPVGDPLAITAALRTQARRQRGLRTCLAKVRRHARGESRLAGRLTGSRRARARRHARAHKSRSRRACLKRWGRTPGRVTGLGARAVSATSILLTFRAPGTHGRRPPAAHTYVIKQSRRPIRSARAFRRAASLCGGSCRFPATTGVGDAVALRVTELRPRTRYYYAVAARDNVSRRAGPRSMDARARTP